MYKQNSDQEWQQIKSNMESFFNQTLASNLPSIEYKPRFVALLEMSSGQQQEDLQEMGT